MASPVRNRLVTWQALILAVLLLIFTGGLYLSLRYHLNQEVNESLLSWAEEQFGRFDRRDALNQKHRGNRAMLPESFSLLLNEKVQPVGKIMLEAEVVAKLQRLVKLSRGYRGAKPLAKTVAFEGNQSFRIFIIRLQHAQGDPAYLVVGRSLTHIRNTLSGLTLLMGVIWLLAVAICSYVSWIFVGRTLRPVNVMTRASLQIAASGELGRRIESFDDNHDEFGELSLALNRMLSALEVSYATQQKFLADASHELRTPLTSIKANLEFLERARQLPEQERAQVLQEISCEVNRMAGLVNELLLLARVDGQASLQLQPVNLRRIVAETLAGLEQRLTAAGQNVACDLTPDKDVLGDPDKLKQLLLIILDNALKYTPSQGRIGIRLEVRAAQVMLTVDDNGPGILPAELPLVWERFYRGSNTLGINGSGLGLAIAKAIVAYHHGTIQLTNIAPHGLCVTVTLPRMVAAS